MAPDSWRDVPPGPLSDVDVSRLLEITERPEVKSLLDNWHTGSGRHMARRPGVYGAALHPRLTGSLLQSANTLKFLDELQ